jgi:hypothetical protein
LVVFLFEINSCLLLGSGKLVVGCAVGRKHILPFNFGKVNNYNHNRNHSLIPAYDEWIQTLSMMTSTAQNATE